MKEIHWGVEVTRNGVHLLSLSFNTIAGCKTFTADDEEAIRLAGEHLLAFIGAREEEEEA